MAKTVADYEAEGAAAHSNNTVLPFTEAKSWQQKAILAGYNAAMETNRQASEQSVAQFETKSAPTAVLEHIAHLRSELVKSSPERKARIEAKIARLQTKWGL